MRAFCFGFLAVGAVAFFIGANPANDDQAKKDKDLVQGTWKAVSGEAGGQELPEDGLKQANITLSIKGENYTFEGAGQSEEGKVKLNSDKKPKTIDFIIESGQDKGKTQLGIYAIEDGKLKLCVAKAGNTDRPTTFKTKAGSEDGFFVFKKQE